MLAGKFLSCGGLLGSIMAGSGEEERLPRTRHYYTTSTTQHVSNTHHDIIYEISFMKYHL